MNLSSAICAEFRTISSLLVSPARSRRSAESALEPTYNFTVTNLGLVGLGCRRHVSSDFGDPSLRILRRGNSGNETQGNHLLDHNYLCCNHHGHIGRNGVCTLHCVHEGACTTRLPELFLQHSGMGKVDWCSGLTGAWNT